MNQKSNLLFFSGTECPHCEAMRVFCDRLNRELRCEVLELEVWNNEKNNRLYENYREVAGCNGLPLFVNTKTAVMLCGEVSYSLLKKWAEGANVIQ